MSSLSHSLRMALMRKANNQKSAFQKGFTLIELMVVVAIIGVLSAVSLPALTSAQNQAKSTAAKQEAVNAAKTCTIALIGGDATEITAADVALITDADITTAGATCDVSESFAFKGGDDTWTVTLDANGVGSVPSKS